MSEPVRPTLLSVRAVAERLAVNAKTVRRLVHTGSLPAIRIPGGQLRVAQSDLDALLEAARIAPTMPAAGSQDTAPGWQVPDRRTLTPGERKALQVLDDLREEAVSVFARLGPRAK